VAKMEEFLDSVHGHGQVVGDVVKRIFMQAEIM
jgi:hypothetical protein